MHCTSCALSDVPEPDLHSSPCSEGTLAYFFSTQAIASLAQAAGFETVECEYARVQVRAVRRVASALHHCVGRWFMRSRFRLCGRCCTADLQPCPILLSRPQPVPRSCATARTVRPCGACLCTACSASPLMRHPVPPAPLPSLSPFYGYCHYNAGLKQCLLSCCDHAIHLIVKFVTLQSCAVAVSGLVECIKLESDLKRVFYAALFPREAAELLRLLRLQRKACWKLACQPINRRQGRAHLTAILRGRTFDGAAHVLPSCQAAHSKQGSPAAHVLWGVGPSVA